VADLTEPREAVRGRHTQSAAHAAQGAQAEGRARESNGCCEPEVLARCCAPAAREDCCGTPPAGGPPASCGCGA
jgi:hypothetical protein